MKKIYREIEFAYAENLKGNVKKIAEGNNITKGLVVIKTTIDSPPQYEVVQVETSPTEFIRELAREENIDLNLALRRVSEKEY